MWIRSKRYMAAFSIVEVMVSLVITAIIVGLIFGIFTIVSKQIMDFKKENEQTADFNRLSYSLNKTIFDCEKMTLKKNGIAFQTYDGDTLFYQKEGAVFLRKSKTFIDTFAIQINRIDMDSISNAAKSKVFQKLEIDILINNEEIPLRLYKPIYANQLILWGK